MFITNLALVRCIYQVATITKPRLKWTSDRAYLKITDGPNRGLATGCLSASDRSSAELTAWLLRSIGKGASALTQSDVTGRRSSLARMTSADLVQRKGLGLALCSAR